MYTSGTTGRPKGIRRPIPPGDPDLLANANALFGRAFDFRPFDGPMLVSTGMFHGGSHSYYMGGLNVGHALVIMDRFEPERTLQLIEQYRVRTAYMVPTQFHRLLQLPPEVRERYDHSSLHSVVHSAAPCPPEVKAQMMEWWGPVIWETYGGMEGAATIAKPHRWLEKPGTVGRSIRGVRLLILDDDGNEVPAGTVGEVYMENGVGFSYHDDPDETDRVHRGKQFTLGDLGHLDDDGYLFIDGRAKDMIITGGTNVYPAEIEAALLLHPDIVDTGVFGVPDPDWGESIVAAVQLRPGVEPSAETRSRADRVLSREARQLQVPAPLGVPRGPAADGGREALQAAAPRRVHRHTGGTIEMTETSKSTHEAFKVDAELEKEFEKALSYTLDDGDIDRARLLLGVDVASRARELNCEANTDSLRNWAMGVGDDNPLYIDEDYGRATRWGSQVGHGTQMGHLKSPMYGDPIPEELRQQTKSLFRGIHVFVSGGTWDWYRPLRPGDRIYSFAGEETLDVKASDFAGKSVIQVNRNVMINQHGEVLGVYRILRVLTERQKSRDKGKYADIEPAHYTDADYERIDEIYASERPRGSETRVLGRRRGRRGAAPDGEGPDDRHRDDRVPLGRIRLRAVRASLLTARLPEPSAHQAVLHQERTGCVGRRAAAALGQRLGQGDRQPDGLRLRRAAPVLVLPPPLGLGRRRRLHRADGRLDPQVQLHGRHPIPHRDRHRQARGGRPAPGRRRTAHDQPARHRNGIRLGNHRARLAGERSPDLPCRARRAPPAGIDDVRPPQRARCGPAPTR